MALQVSVIAIGMRVEAASAKPAKDTGDDLARGQSQQPTTGAGSKDATREWKTEKEGRVVELHPGVKFVMAPGSHVLRLPNISVSLGSSEYAKSAYSLDLVSGRIDVHIDSSLRPIYGVVVRAPRKVGAVVKGGRATVLVTPDGVTVAARSGRDMMIGVGERWRPLTVGWALTISKAVPEGKAYSLLAPPQASISSPLTLTLGTASIAPQMSWSEVGNATGYAVRLYRQLDHELTLIREQRVTERTLTLDGLGAGQYRATAAAIDASGLESAESQAVELSVVEAILPLGSESVAGVIRIPATERLRFSNAEGLELCYSRKEDDFVPAPPSVGLNQGNSVFIRLRRKGSLQETSFSLEPQELLPTIEMGSAYATWPGPPVYIRVKVANPKGSPAVTTDALFPEVTVNSAKVSVSWKRSNGMMAGLVEKPSTPGPWIVRVELRDARGRIIGRDFLEVAAAGSKANVPSR